MRISTKTMASAELVSSAGKAQATDSLNVSAYGGR